EQFGEFEISQNWLVILVPNNHETWRQLPPNNLFLVQGLEPFGDPGQVLFEAIAVAHWQMLEPVALAPSKSRLTVSVLKFRDAILESVRRLLKIRQVIQKVPFQNTFRRNRNGRIDA